MDASQALSVRTREYHGIDRSPHLGDGMRPMSARSLRVLQMNPNRCVAACDQLAGAHRHWAQRHHAQDCQRPRVG